MPGKHHEQVLDLITTNGPMGVSELAREIGIPASTMQKYLVEQQSYFRRGDDKKWHKPEAVTADIKQGKLELMAVSAETQLKITQAATEELQELLNTLGVTLNAVKKNVQGYKVPVATSEVVQVKIDERLIEVEKDCQKLIAVIKGHRDKIPEEYVKAILNMDFIQLTLDMGQIYVGEMISNPIAEMIMNEREVFSDETLSAIEEYQKES